MQERPTATSSSDSSKLSSQPYGPYSLALPFGILGLLGGWITARAFRVDGYLLEWLLLAVTPLTAAVLGWFLSPRIRSKPLECVLLVVTSTINAGIINGMLIGLCAGPGQRCGMLLGAVVGASCGAICALPFIPAFGAVVFMARRLGRGRPSSMADLHSATSSSDASKLSSETYRPYSLALPFSILGLLGGWLFAMVFLVGHSDYDKLLSWLLIAFSPLTAAVLGWFLSPRIRSKPLECVLLVVMSTVDACIANGMLVFLCFVLMRGSGTLENAFWGAAFGGSCGAACAIPFIPVFGAVVLMARRLGRARSASIVDKADRRAVFRVVWVVASIAWMLSSWLSSGYERTGLTLPFSAVMLLLILLVLDISAFVRTCLLAAGAAAVAKPEAERSERSERAYGASVIDFGLGDEVVEEVVPKGTVYRGDEQRVRVFRGSSLRALAALGRAIVADALAIVFAVALLLMQAARITGAI